MKCLPVSKGLEVIWLKVIEDSYHNGDKYFTTNVLPKGYITWIDKNEFPRFCSTKKGNEVYLVENNRYSKNYPIQDFMVIYPIKRLKTYLL